MNDDFLKVEAELLNLPSVVKQLSNLKNFAETDKEVGKGLKKGAQYLIRIGKKKLRQRMKSGSKGVTGNLLKSFKYRLKKHNTGVLAGFNNKGHHSWLVSEGTKNRFYNGKSRGKVIGNKFWKETRNENANTAMFFVMQSVRQSINNIKNRYNVR